MFNCPECGMEMIWQADFDASDYGEEGYFIQTMSCFDCEIDLQKKHNTG